MQQLPPNPPAAIARLAAERDRLASANRDAGVAVDATRQALADAEAADLGAYAEALRENKPDPGTPTADKARQTVDDAERRLAATAAAVAQLDGELRAAVEKHSAAWRRLVAERRTAEIARARATAGQLAASLDTIRTLVGTAAWLADPTRRYRPARAASRQLLPSGEPVMLDVLVAELTGWLDSITEPGEPEPADAGKVAVAP